MLDDDGLIIKDLGSSNGTLVNGVRIDTRALVEGDVIRIGAEMLEVVVADPSPQRAGSSTAKSLETSVVGDTASFDFDRSSGPPDLDSIAFIEQLVASASETGQPAAMGKPIQMAVDGLLASVRRAGSTLDRPTAIRVAALVEKMAPWYQAGEIDSWRHDVLATLKLGDP